MTLPASCATLPIRYTIRKSPINYIGATVVHNMRSGSLWLNSSMFCAAAKVASLCKISFMIGSYTAFFSLTNCIVPLSGAFAGMCGSSIAVSMSLLVRMVFYGGLLPISYLVHVLPGLFASYYWASKSAAIRVLVPILCMVLFIVHPVGQTAWMYAMYWLVPVILYAIKTKHLFFEALGSTFIAHAVGSIIWLYTVPMPTSMWHVLIPIVLIERLLFASGMVVLHRLVSWIYAKRFIIRNLNVLRCARRIS